MRTTHDPAWPDKALFASLLLVLGGLVSLAVEGLRPVATVRDHLPEALVDLYPYPVTLALVAGMVLCGVACYATHRRGWGYAGAAFGTVSFAYDGVALLLSMLAVALLVKSRLEGEETRNGGVRLHSSDWPDKAMAASLLMVVAGAVLLVEALAVLVGNHESVVLGPVAAVVLNTVAGLACIAFAVPVYRLERPWLGDVAALFSVASLALVVLGPLLGIAVWLYLRLARREDEFAKHHVVPPTPARSG